jgi:type IV pilus assembly protein PilE
MQTGSSKGKTRGFTLIEIMIVVTIVAILASIMIPSYRDHVIRTKLAEAFSALGDFHTRMESFYQDNRSYASNGACGTAIPNTQNFVYQCVLAGNGLQFSATATNKGGVGLDNAGDYQFNINQDGVKNTPAFAGAAGPNGIWKNRK